MNNHIKYEKKEEPVIMFESPEAASIQTVTGWVSSTGRYFGQDERAARYEGSTHHKCDCGGIAKRHYIYCKDCQHKRTKEAYEKLPFEQWDEVGALTLHDGDEFFFSWDDLLSYCEDNDIDPTTLDLLICEPNHLSTIDIECDELPEDASFEDVANKELIAALKLVNNIIEKHPPISWSAGKIRTAVPVELLPSITPSETSAAHESQPETIVD